MKRKLMQNRNVCIIIAGIGALLLAAAGFFLALAFAPDLSKPQTQSEPVDKIGKVSVLPTTEVTWRYHFSDCDHTVAVCTYNGVLGMTEDEVKARFPNAKIIQFDSETVIISNEVDALCPKHYLLIATEPDELAVFHTSTDSFETICVANITIDSKKISSQISAELAEGIVFDSMSEINAYLEDIES